ncbi:hypothetical protein AQUCO_05700016v1 [Aquilegia coerulea]|uniref:F-box associated domain-containing protein n=1 Tax=Aquilegia coerulea TaxID=218851 RepID=A0A2G5CFG9_AQUCA|nr:hypothetical protein AQUCO_05700016v1 [Aquilegia coerulea]
MQDYGNQESWTKEYIINKNLLRPLPSFCQILRMVRNDRILFHSSDGQGYYDVTKNERMKHVLIRGLPQRFQVSSPRGTSSWNGPEYKRYVNLDAVVHVGSLISPGRLANG